MLYHYEEWVDPETGWTDVQQHEITRSCYEHLHNFIGVGEWAGQSGTSVVYGMMVKWSVIYCGY